jgi:hypothetical protein
MMANVAVCVYCSYKVKEMEKSVNVPHSPGSVAHLACAQKVAIRTASPKGDHRPDDYQYALR